MTALARESSSSPSGWKRFFGLDLLDNRYAALHGLRVLAIVSVVQFHITWIFAGEQNIAIDDAFMKGSLTIFFGMDLFFILSGFLIGSILLRSLATHKTQNLRRFYLRRILRTFPSYWLILAILAVTTHLSASQRAHLPHELLYATNFLPLGRTDVIMFWGWSLALEEQFYLTVPLLFFVLHRIRSTRARLALLGVLWAAALVIRLTIYVRYAPWNDFTLYSALYFRTMTRFDTLVCGLILAFVHAEYGERLRAWLVLPVRRAVLALIALSCMWVLLRPTLFGAEHLQLVHVFAWGTITSVMWMCLLVLLLHAEGPIQRVLSAAVFRRMATLGYGIYLVHIPLIDRVFVPLARALQKRGVSMIIIWPSSIVLTMAMSLAIGYALHLLIEKPSLRLRERLAA
jgi:peptidoglycan/LPS O-acetylase OafA/YrhL